VLTANFAWRGAGPAERLPLPWASLSALRIPASRKAAVQGHYFGSKRFAQIRRLGAFSGLLVSLSCITPASPAARGVSRLRRSTAVAVALVRSHREYRVAVVRDGVLDGVEMGEASPLPVALSPDPPMNFGW
jgi:hypothetical protein